MFQERRTHDRRQTTRSGRRATDPREPDGLEEWPAADASDLTPLEKALVVTRRDVTIQSRQIAALHAELDGIKGVIRRLTDAVQILTATRPKNPQSDGL